MCCPPTSMPARDGKNIVFHDASTQIGPFLLWPKRERPHPPRLLTTHGGKSVANKGWGGGCHAPALLVR